MTETINTEQYHNLIRKNKVSGTRIITKKQKRGKFNNTIIHDEQWGKFDSKKEYEEWKRLLALAKTGAIQDLQRQVRIPLIVNRNKVCTYVCDMVYVFKGEKIYHDVKGKRTDVYILKKKLLHALTGIWIKET